jgi:hypothetical protein
MAINVHDCYFHKLLHPEQMHMFLFLQKLTCKIYPTTLILLLCRPYVWVFVCVMRVRHSAVGQLFGRMPLLTEHYGMS